MELFDNFWIGEQLVHGPCSAARERAARFFDGLNQHRELVRNRRKTSYEPHTLKVNDIITNSWGYDQTNVDWYRIVKTSRHYVWLKPICAEIEETGFMSGKSAPRELFGQLIQITTHVGRPWRRSRHSQPRFIDQPELLPTPPLRLRAMLLVKREVLWPRSSQVLQRPASGRTSAGAGA